MPCRLISTGHAHTNKVNSIGSQAVLPSFRVQPILIGRIHQDVTIPKVRLQRVDSLIANAAKRHAEHENLRGRQAFAQALVVSAVLDLVLEFRFLCMVEEKAVVVFGRVMKTHFNSEFGKQERHHAPHVACSYHAKLSPRDHVSSLPSEMRCNLRGGG
jgi:hypothetical protein